MSPTTHVKSAPGAAVKVKTGLPQLSESVPTTRYWVGTTPACPIWNVVVGGICFPRFRGTPNFDERGEPDRKLDYGAYADLSDDQVEYVRGSVERRIIRFGSPPHEPGTDTEERPKSLRQRRGTIVPIDGKDSVVPTGRPRQVLRPHDEPLARYLYMLRFDKMSAEQHKEFPPEVMELVEKKE